MISPHRKERPHATRNPRLDAIAHTFFDPDAGRQHVELVIEIDEEEWRRVGATVAPFAHDDESTAIGHVLLSGDDGRRSWAATDSHRLAVLKGGPWPHDIRVTIPRRVIWSAVDLLDFGHHPILVVQVDEDDEPRRVAIRTSATEIDVPVGPCDPPDIAAMVEKTLDEPYMDVRVSRRLLHAVVAAARKMPHGHVLDDDDPGPPFLIDVAPDRLAINIDWGAFGVSTYSVAVSAEAASRVQVNPRYLEELLICLERVGADDEVVLSLPADRRGPWFVHAHDWSGYLMPFDTTAERFRPRLEHLLEVIGLGDIERDEDGDYWFRFGTADLYVRLADLEPARVQVFSVVLRDVEDTDELLRELNGINAGIAFARAFHVGGQVLVEAELVAETLDAAEIGHACQTVVRVANDLGPVLQSAFGGQTAFAPEET